MKVVSRLTKKETCRSPSIEVSLIVLTIVCLTSTFCCCIDWGFLKALKSADCANTDQLLIGCYVGVQDFYLH